MLTSIAYTVYSACNSILGQNQVMVHAEAGIKYYAALPVVSVSWGADYVSR